MSTIGLHRWRCGSDGGVVEVQGYELLLPYAMLRAGWRPSAIADTVYSYVSAQAIIHRCMAGGPFNDSEGTMTSKYAAAQSRPEDAVGATRTSESDPAALNAATRKLNDLLESVPKDPAAAPHFQDATRRLAMLAVMPKIRSHRKLSQANVAAAMGTTQSAVSDLESGRVDPQLRTLQRYARAIKRRLDFGLVDEELPTFDEGTANGLWRLVERNALSASP